MPCGGGHSLMRSSHTLLMPLNSTEIYAGTLANTGDYAIPDLSETRHGSMIHDLPQMDRAATMSSYSVYGRLNGVADGQWVMHWTRWPARKSPRVPSCHHSNCFSTPCDRCGIFRSRFLSLAGQDRSFRGGGRQPSARRGHLTGGTEGKIPGSRCKIQRAARAFCLHNFPILHLWFAVKPRHSECSTPVVELLSFIATILC
jgi:hypothetical protein